MMCIDLLINAENFCDCQSHESGCSWILLDQQLSRQYITLIRIFEGVQKITYKESFGIFSDQFDIL